MSLREQLPVIPIPLRLGDGAAHVDLQEVLNRAYDGPGYEHAIYREHTRTTALGRRRRVGAGAARGAESNVTRRSTQIAWAWHSQCLSSFVGSLSCRYHLDNGIAIG